MHATAASKILEGALIKVSVVGGFGINLAKNDLTPFNTKMKIPEIYFVRLNGYIIIINGVTPNLV